MAGKKNRKLSAGQDPVTRQYAWRKDKTLQLKVKSSVHDAFSKAAERCGYSSMSAFIRDAVCSHISSAGMGDLLKPEAVCYELPLNVKECGLVYRYPRALRSFRDRMPIPLSSQDEWLRLLDREAELAGEIDHY